MVLAWISLAKGHFSKKNPKRTAEHVLPPEAVQAWVMAFVL